MDYPIVLIGFVIVLVPMLTTSAVWFLARRLSQPKRWVVSLFIGGLAILLPAADMVRREYVPGDPDVLWAFAFVIAVALGASGSALAVLHLLNIGEGH